MLTVNEHEQHSVSIATREIQIIFTLRFHFVPVRTAKKKTQTTQMLEKLWRRRTLKMQMLRM